MPTKTVTPQALYEEAARHIVKAMDAEDVNEGGAARTPEEFEKEVAEFLEEPSFPSLVDFVFAAGVRHGS